jgi:hypothetical protein
MTTQHNVPRVLYAAEEDIRLWQEATHHWRHLFEYASAEIKVLRKQRTVLVWCYAAYMTLATVVAVWGWLR